MLEFFEGVVLKAELQHTDVGLRGYGLIKPDASEERVWFGSKTTNETMLEAGQRVRFALASSRSTSGRLAASIVRPVE